MVEVDGNAPLEPTKAPLGAREAGRVDPEPDRCPGGIDAPARREGGRGHCLKDGERHDRARYPTGIAKLDTLHLSLREVSGL